jgi:hypothetical protein
MPDVAATWLIRAFSPGPLSPSIASLAPTGVEQVQDRVGAVGESPRLDQCRLARDEPERDFPDDRCRGLPDHLGRCRRDGYGRHGSDGGEKSAGAEGERRAE